MMLVKDMPGIANTTAGRELIVEGREERREEGRLEGSRNLLLNMAQHKFGLLGERLPVMIHLLACEQTVALGKELLTMHAPEELALWLERACGKPL